MSLPLRDGQFGHQRFAEEQVLGLNAADSEPPWWKRGFSVAGIVALLAALVPAANFAQSAVGSWDSRKVAEQERKSRRIVAEHELVSEYLEAALAKDTADHDHMRLMAFLRELPKRGEEGEVDFLRTLATWSSREYDAYFEYLNYRAKNLTEVYEAKLLERLRHDRILLTGNHWIQGDADRSEAIKDRVCGKLSETISELDSELQRIRSEWRKIRKEFIVASALDECTVCNESTELVFEDGLLWLEARCELTTPLGTLSPVQLLSAAFQGTLLPIVRYGRSTAIDYCNELGQQLWARSLHGQLRNRLQDAAMIFRDSCERNKDMEGCGLLGRSLAKGKGVARDIDKAIEYLERSCPIAELTQAIPEGDDIPSPLGCNSLGWRNLQADQEGSRLSSKPEVDRATDAHRLFQYACDGGYMNGCDSLGWLYAAESKTAADAGNDVDAAEFMAKAEEVLGYACGRLEVRACINLERLAEQKVLRTFSLH